MAWIETVPDDASVPTAEGDLAAHYDAVVDTTLG